MDKVKDKKAPAITPGRIIGKVTVKKVFIYPHPGPSHASSTDLSKPANLALTVITTNGITEGCMGLVKDTNPHGNLRDVEYGPAKKYQGQSTGMTTGKYS
jgi:hypothetical protein